jgi:hypothetical protein
MAAMQRREIPVAAGRRDGRERSNAGSCELLVLVCPRSRRDTSVNPARHALYTVIDAHILPGKTTLLPDWNGFCTSAARVPIFSVALHGSSVST